MKKYLYAKDKEPIIVDQCQEIEGWFDSPLPFVLTTEFGVDPIEKEKVQLLGESIMEVTEYCNGMLNLKTMKMKELRDFAKKFYSVKAKSRKKLINKIEALQWQPQQISSRVH